MTRYVMAIDVKACVACHACTIACKSNNNLPNSIIWHHVYTDGGEYMDTATGTYPNDLHRAYYPVGCQHCSKPACVASCPTGATYIRDDGIIATNPEECLGCDACVTACPYDARTLITEEPEYVVDFPLGDWDAPQHLVGAASKCTFCVNRIERGDVPACMDLCPGGARFWGDLDDPDSEISKVLAEREYIRLLEDAGTEPNCYYLV